MHEAVWCDRCVSTSQNSRLLLCCCIHDEELLLSNIAVYNIVLITCRCAVFAKAVRACVWDALSICSSPLLWGDGGHEEGFRGGR